MSPELEEALWRAVPECGVSRGWGAPHPVRQWINDACESGLLKSPKQAWRTLEKWCSQDCYEYGVTLDLGWRTGKPRTERQS